MQSARSVLMLTSSFPFLALALSLFLSQVCENKTKAEIAALKELDKEKIALEEARALAEHKAMIAKKHAEEEEKVCVLVRLCACVGACYLCRSCMS